MNSLKIKISSNLMPNKLKVNTLSNNTKITMILSSNPIISPMTSYNSQKKKHPISMICNKPVMLNSTNTTLTKTIHTPSKNHLNLPHPIPTKPTLLTTIDFHSHQFHINNPIHQTKTQMSKISICTLKLTISFKIHQNLIISMQSINKFNNLLTNQKPSCMNSKRKETKIRK